MQFFLLGFGQFSGAMYGYVSFREGIPPKMKTNPQLHYQSTQLSINSVLTPEKKKNIRNPPPPNKPPSGFRDTNGFAAFEGEIHQVGLQLDILMAGHWWVAR